jgi:hypothetical protein
VLRSASPPASDRYRWRSATPQAMLRTIGFATRV